MREVIAEEAAERPHEYAFAGALFAEKGNGHSDWLVELMYTPCHPTDKVVVQLLLAGTDHREYVLLHELPATGGRLDAEAAVDVEHVTTNFQRAARLKHRSLTDVLP